MIKPYYEEELVTIYQGDCYDILSSMESKSIDLILTDPPYGIGADKGVGGFGSSSHTAKSYHDNWDIKPEKKVFDQILRVSKNAIVFGGNFFTDMLPAGGHWIIWDKIGNIKFNNPYGQGELAWTNFDRKSTRKFTCIQQGFVSEEKQRYHPTQKPTRLFTDILTTYLDKQIKAIVLDPYLGSGTTCIAAKQLGLKSIGIEVSEQYCQIAKNRLQEVEDESPVYKYFEAKDCQNAKCKHSPNFKGLRTVDIGEVFYDLHSTNYHLKKAIDEHGIYLKPSYGTGYLYKKLYQNYPKLLKQFKELQQLIDQIDTLRRPKKNSPPYSLKLVFAALLCR